MVSRIRVGAADREPTPDWEPYLIKKNQLGIEPVIEPTAREEAINTLVTIMDDPKAPPAARVAAANSLLDRGYGKSTQPISQTLTKIDPNTMSDAELAAIVRNGIQADARPH